MTLAPNDLKIPNTPVAGEENRINPLAFLMQYATDGQAVFARMSKVGPEGPYETNILIRESMAQIKAISRSPSIESRCMAVERSVNGKPVVVVLTMFLIGGELYACWWNYHGDGEAANADEFHDLTQQPELAFLFAAEGEVRRCIKTKNPALDLFRDAVEQIERRNLKWTWQDFAVVQRAFECAHPTLLSIWRELGRHGESSKTGPVLVPKTVPIV